MSESQIEVIRSAVPTLVAEGDDAHTAQEDAKGAAAVLLQRVIDHARPALRYVGTRPRISMSDPCDDRRPTKYTYYASRCIALVGETGPDLEDYGNYGRYHGYDLFLRDDGRLVQFQYAGHWNAYQNEPIWWRAIEPWDNGDAEHPAAITVYTSVADAVRDGWTDVDGYIAEISAAMTKALGSRVGATKAARQRAVRLSALAQLLGAG